MENTSWLVLGLGGGGWEVRGGKKKQRDRERDDYQNINILLTHISPPNIASSEYFAEG